MTVLVLLAGLGETALPEKVRVLPMPAYAVSVANILNGKDKTRFFREGDSNDFIIPEARLLVVDDIPANLRVAEGFLAPYRVQVDSCPGGAEALELFKERRYDLVFMDHMMPGMDGIEAVRLIRLWEKEYRGNQRVPVIALTANAVSGMREMFLEKGFDDFLSKPIEIFRLNDILKTWIPPEKQMQKSGKEHTVERMDIFGNTVIEGIDLQKGLEEYGEKAYLEVLRTWCMHTPVLLERLRKLTEGTLAGENLKEYVITVHGIKGSTYGIYAGGIAEKAAELEDAAYRTDLRFIAANTGLFAVEAAGLYQNLENLLADITRQEPVKLRANSPDPELLAQFFKACKQFRSSCMMEILDKLEVYEYESGGDLMKWLREQTDNLEYDAINERLAAELEGKQ